MLVYWLLFAYFAVGAIIAGSLSGGDWRRPSVLYTFGILLAALLIGLRYRVGGDWDSYQFIYDRLGPLDFSEALSVGDPGYQAFNWFAYFTGYGVWVANLCCAAIFVWGLSRFCRVQRAPWLAALVAIPYVVIVIAMGYTRQAVALAILMAGIADFIQKPSPFRFGLYVVAAALFHKTAVVALPLVALATERNRFMNFLIVIAGGYFLYDMFLGNAMDHFVQNYVRTGYSSQGAAIRVIMSTLAALVLWIARGRLEFSSIEWKIWRNYSLASLVSLLMLAVSPSSTAVDRLSLYIIPLQIAVISRIPLLFRSKMFGTVVIALYCFMIQFVWLNFAQFANKWVPYHFYPI